MIRKLINFMVEFIAWRSAIMPVMPPKSMDVQTGGKTAVRRVNGCLKVTFHIKYGPEALFERIHYKMDNVKTVEMTSRCVEQARQQRIPQEVLDRVETFGSIGADDADDWELVACEARMDTGKFVTSTWTTEYVGETYWLTIGPENMAERISRKDSEYEDRAVKHGDFYKYVKAVNRGLMKDARPMIV